MSVESNQNNADFVCYVDQNQKKAIFRSRKDNFHCIQEYGNVLRALLLLKLFFPAVY